MKNFTNLVQLTDAQQTDLKNTLKWFPGREDYVESRREALLAHNYVEQFLKKTLSAPGRFSGRCLSSGIMHYQRKDGGAITQDDLDAVGADFLGQENKVDQIDVLTIRREWLCDSGD